MLTIVSHNHCTIAAEATALGAIVLSAGPDGLVANAKGFYVNPVRDYVETSVTPNCALFYDRDGATGEIVYDCSGTRRRLEEQEAMETRIAELERKLESALAAEARIAELEAQVKALIEKAPAA
jgi:hypothetical protein